MNILSRPNGDPPADFSNFELRFHRGSKIVPGFAAAGRVVLYRATYPQLSAGAMAQPAV